MAKKIPLTQGKSAIVDDDDFDFLMQWKWYFNGKYAVRGVNTGKTGKKIWMHRVIAKTPDGMDTDHVNRDRLDNRKANLRHATPSQNSCNRRGFSKLGNPKGVVWSKDHGTWRVKIKVEGREIHIGYFDSPDEAATAYDKAARQHHKEFALTNS